MTLAPHQPVTNVVVEADGGARGNPGPSGYGAVVRDAETGEVLAERSGGLGISTNNVAEYTGLIAGLTAAAELGAREVDVRMDSKLVVEQMSGRWQIRHPGLRQLAAQVASLVRGFDRVRFGWVPRERNRHADALANKAMDEAAAAPGADRAAARAGQAAATRIAPHAEPLPAAAITPEPAVAPEPTVAPQPAVPPQPGVTPPPSGAQPRAAAPRRSWEPRLAEPTRLILVRHGQTEMTAQRRYSGRGDVPLSAFGRAQARAAAARLAALPRPVAAVVASPLQRCTQTASVLAAALGDPPVRTDPDLVECDFGDWEGLTFGQVREQWPDEMQRWLDSTAVAPPGGESMRTVAARTRRATERLIGRYPSQCVVVVSHVSPIKLLLCDALGAGDELLHRLYLDATGLSIVDYWADGGIAVRTVNDTAHLTGLGAVTEAVGPEAGATDPAAPGPAGLDA